MLQSVAELLTEGLDVRYGQTVSKIEHSGQSAQVTTQDGTVLDADFVVCTVSLGVLKVCCSADKPCHLPASAAACAVGLTGCQRHLHPHLLGETRELLQVACRGALCWGHPGRCWSVCKAACSPCHRLQGGWASAVSFVARPDQCGFLPV